jgi:hypothetical protein
MTAHSYIHASIGHKEENSPQWRMPRPERHTGGGGGEVEEARWWRRPSVEDAKPVKEMA